MTASLGPRADSDLAGAPVLLDRCPARAHARETVHVRRGTEDDQIEVVQRRQRVVDRDDLDVALLAERGGDSLRQALGVSEPRLVDHERSHEKTSLQLSIARSRRRAVAASVGLPIRLLGYRT